jgi:flavin reductase (DIM6/NTAB) family NADH-FMN oxidoreductase RutF
MTEREHPVRSREAGDETLSDGAPGAPAIPPGLFRDVMGRFVTGVTVITADWGGFPRGMTANAFLSGSLDPPLGVVSVAKRARMHECLSEVSRFAVNILADDQEAYARHFSGRAVAGLKAEFETVEGVPVLARTVARIVADIDARHDSGDHTLFVGHIRHMAAGDRVPLLYYRGRFGSLARGLVGSDVPVPEFW